jgi:ABC-type amino acid transport substrate-binding protein
LKTSSLLAIFLLLVILLSNSAAAEKALLRFAQFKVQQPLPPYIWYNSCEQRAEGVIPALFQRLSKDTDYAITLSADPDSGKAWQDLQQLRLQRLLNDDIDLYYSSPQFLDHPDLVMASTPVFSVQQIVVLKQSLAGLTELAQLKPYRGAFAGYKEGKQSKTLQQLGLNIVSVKGSLELFSLLTSDLVDCIIIERRLANYFIKKFSLQQQATLSAIVVGNTKVHFYVKRGRGFEPFLTQSSQLLQQYQQSGLTEQLTYNMLQRWFNLPAACLQR